MPKAIRSRWLDSLSPTELRIVECDWAFWARPDQLAPAGEDWTTWLVLGGRGAGKTRAGAEWVRGEIEGASPLGAGRIGRTALVGETFRDVREVMIEGPSGLRAIATPGFRPTYEASRRRLVWPNGATAYAFSSDEPDTLRGPQFEIAWSDELCKWRYADQTWSNLQLALRLGARPRQAATTTPRPIKLLKDLLAQPGVAVARASSYANRAHLAAAFFNEIASRYEGTLIGRQELLGELIAETPGAFWRLDELETMRVSPPDDLTRIVVAVDPPASAGPAADECGIIVAGVKDGVGYVLQDLSAGGLSPAGWASRAVGAYRAHNADRIVAEANQGGDMVRAVIRQADPATAVRLVRATRGKSVRAEPVAALYERGRVKHARAFRELENQMIAFTGERIGGRSPDRVDALVWALTDLMLRDADRPQLREL